MGYIRKALEKGYLERPGSACCTDNIFEIFVRFGRFMCCLLPLFVNRQPPCLQRNSRHGLLLPLKHHRSLWCAKGLALGEHSGCGCNGMSLVAGQRSPVATCMHPQGARHSDDH